MNTKSNGLPGGKHTLVEEGTEFKGTLSSKCPIVVMGKVEGDVTGPIIQVTPTGTVAGNVKVQELRSDGELAGDVQADSVRISGRVRDKTVIRARTLEVSLSAAKPGTGMEVVFGECELAIGDEPNKEQAVAAALASPAAPAPAPVHPPAKAEPAKAEKHEAKPEAKADEPKRPASKTLPPPTA
jgi:cytoskeletal protein CcmA (bactofilin family)